MLFIVDENKTNKYKNNIMTILYSCNILSNQDT